MKRSYRPSSGRSINSEYMKASHKLGGYIGVKLSSNTFDQDNKNSSISIDKIAKVILT